MKTTVEISDNLLDEAKRLAARERTTVKALIEQGLRQIISTKKKPGVFRLRKATFKGQGLQSGVSTATWEQIRDMAYEGHGG
ncbi:MAG TPA: type II toxin-antitoxin system VapB family antitoxin [Candidatus Limnocylindrales bacterium]|nr:type II toxin-antitoxin system VapB family antitoxin [Candidatus Limnocylindrales bacterium]